MSTPPAGGLSRRSFLTATALGAATLATSATLAPKAHAYTGAPGPVLGTVIDYSAGVPSAAAIKAAGHLGAVRYVSQRRPDAQWMKGKPVTLAETRAQAAAGLATASVYQFGRASTADWLQGAAGAATHAPQAIALHKAAGGPTGRPIYIAIDDNPTRAQYDSLIRPYLLAFSAALRAAGYSTGIYGNYNVIEWASREGIGSFYWMHDWGSNGKIHPRTTIHQLPQNRQATIDGVVVDINNVYARDWGQWTPGQRPAPAPTPVDPGAAIAPQDVLSQLSSRMGGSSLTPQQLQGGIDLLTTIGKAVR
ncbi:DUF1906 domain-containing protein [Corynebacterium lizhenjunii]|uniref:DUF1906 domain-containing protein n=1 Tax=Corynebacterium lizhenjunii TaxID=2709394 RepID=A0A7T0KG35_9CORY|nr:DUF1906 domain-containing protein [Corynebacterium lizhenjunii]QPK79766.1 DUF1906 domain-containing protein [Corynebacterium lizhenjunii]